MQLNQTEPNKPIQIKPNETKPTNLWALTHQTKPKETPKRVLHKQIVRTDSPNKQTNCEQNFNSPNKTIHTNLQMEPTQRN
jgi:hypothetical protein